jgi:hypothetical protein
MLEPHNYPANGALMPLRHDSLRKEWQHVTTLLTHNGEIRTQQGDSWWCIKWAGFPLGLVPEHCHSSCENLETLHRSPGCSRQSSFRRSRQ